jgi:hypothetical protein
MSRERRKWGKRDQGPIHCICIQVDIVIAIFSSVRPQVWFMSVRNCSVQGLSLPCRCVKLATAAAKYLLCRASAEGLRGKEKRL